MPALNLHRALDSLSVGHLGGVQSHLGAELPLEPLGDDVKVNLAHAGYKQFARLRFLGVPKSWVLLLQPGQSLPYLVFVAFGLRPVSHGQHRRREPDGIEHDRLVLVGKRVAGSGLAQLGNSGNVARADLSCCNLLLALDQEHLAQALGPVLAGIIYLRIRLDHT